jgi:phosphoglycerate-specific signal transduction histidine kinase
LLGDHIKNAIIAVQNNRNTNRSILVLLGVIEEHYQIWVYDSGIEFEVDTLLKLGLERITTHKEDGGSGIGFMTSFEILEKNKASIIIEENSPSSNDYTKIIKIKFDGKKDYKIISIVQMK